MAIKLVAIDIDGTLINDQLEVTPKTVAAIKKATKAGVKIVLCTGRPMTGVRPFIHQLGLENLSDEYVIAYNGGLALATNGDILVNYTVSFKDYLALEMFCLEHDVKSIIESRDYIYTTNQDISPIAVHESGLVFMPMRYRSLDRLGAMKDDLVIGKVMMTDNKEVLDRAQAALPEELVQRFRIVRSEDYYLEFVNKQAGKGPTLDALANHLGFKPSEVMAIGNAQNDESMIKYAGTGVAMGNAISSTVKAADIQVADNNHDGVAEAIDKYVL